MLKSKNSKFSERKLPTVLPPALVSVPEHFKDIAEYVNEARLNAVISKHGEFDAKQTKKLTGLFIKDIADEYKDTHTIKKEDKKVFGKSIALLANSFVRSYLLKKSEH